MSGHGWVSDKAVRHVLRLRGAVGQRSPRVVEYTPCGVVRCSPCETVRPTLPCGVVCHRLPRTVARSCRAGLPKHSSCRPFVQPCCVGSFVSVVARGIPPATQGTGQHLLRGVLAVLGRQCSSGQSGQRQPDINALAGPSVLVRTVRSALVVRGRLLKDRSTHLTGSLGSTQTELGPLVGGESECLGGVGQ